MAYTIFFTPLIAYNDNDINIRAVKNFKEYYLKTQLSIKIQIKIDQVLIAKPVIDYLL